MRPERLIGTWPMRLAALLLVAACAASWLQHVRQGMESGLFVPSIILSVLTFIALVHTGRLVFTLWMRIAEKIQVTVVAALFSVSYLMLVPLVWLFAWSRDSLGLQNTEASTYWTKCRDEERTLEFFQRTG